MQDKFETWAIVELFGHNKIAGKVSEQTIGGSSMVRVDVPDTEAAPAFTRLLNVSAIYAINPVTEEVAIAYAGRIQSKPIETWDAREVLRRIDEQKKLNAPVSEPHGGTGFDEDEELKRKEELEKKTQATLFVQHQVNDGWWRWKFR